MRTISLDKGTSIAGGDLPPLQSAANRKAMVQALDVDWIPVLALPGLDLASAVGCELAVLAPAHDPRVEARRRHDCGLDAFLDRFADTFGEQFEPALLLIAENAPEAAFQAEAVTGFRNAVALAGIMPAWSRALQNGWALEPLWADAYDFFPWMVSKEGNGLIGRSPALLGSHDIAALRGQPSPLLGRHSTDASNFDPQLLKVLLSRWAKHFGDDVTPTWRDRALFRSMNMAFSAARVPSGPAEVYYDYGRIAALWVSAFEILVHPGEGGRANLAKVIDLLEGAPWVLDEASLKRNEVPVSKREVRQVTCGSWLYEKLYRCRCAFLHGDPVEVDMLFVEPCRKPITHFAAPLYRAALAAFLGVQFSSPPPSVEDDNGKALGRWIAEKMNFENDQKHVETALLISRQPPRRQGRAR